MTRIKITSARCAAPVVSRSFADKARGYRPTRRVVLATDTEGRDWQHPRMFDHNEFDKATDLMFKVERAGDIDPTIWRRCK